MRRYGAAYALIVVGLLDAGCGGSSPQPPSIPSPSPDGGSGEVELVGGERLGWDQLASHRDDLQSYEYVLLVDSVPGSLGDVRCSNTAGEAGFECSGLLPSMSLGRHTLQLATRGPNGQSVPSASLAVRVVARSQAPGLQSSTSSGGERSATAAACLAPAGEPCYVTQNVAEVDADIFSIAALPDGRALVVQNGRGVIGFDLTGAAPQPALEFDSGVLNGSIAVDPLFTQSRFVFLALTLAEPSGPVVNVVRYREVGGVLGQAATLVSGIRTRETSGTPKIAIGDGGRIYVGLSSVIQRYDADGTVPRTAVAASPAFARAPRRLTGMAWQPSENQLWLSGIDGGQSLLLFLDLTRRSPYTQVGTAIDLPGADVRVAAISAVRRDARTPGGLVVLVSGNELLWKPDVEARGNRRAQWSSLRLAGEQREASLLSAWDASLIWLFAPEKRPHSGGRVFALRRH